MDRTAWLVFHRHSKIENTERYLGIDVNDVLAFAEKIQASDRLLFCAEEQKLSCSGSEWRLFEVRFPSPDILEAIQLLSSAL